MIDRLALEHQASADAWGRYFPASSNGNGKEVGPPLEGKAFRESGVTFVGDERSIVRILSGGSIETEAASRQTAFAASCLIYAAMRWRAQKIAEPGLYVALRERKTGEEKPFDHNLDRIFEEPNPDQDLGQFLEELELALFATGAVCIVKQFDGLDRSAGFRLFNGDEFDTYPADGRFYGRFRVDTFAGSKTYNADEVIHIRDPHPFLRRGTVSRLDAALSWLNLGLSTKATIRSLLKNSLMPGGVISPDAEWQPEDDDWTEYKKAIEQYAKTDNKGRPLVLLGGTTFSSTAVPLYQLIPGELFNRVEAMVALASGVRPEILGYLVGLQNSPWSHIETARKISYEDAIQPQWRRIEKAFTRQALDPAERARGLVVRFDIAGIATLQDDDESRASVQAQNKDIWTIGERRRYTGLDPFGDERDDEVQSGAAVAAAIAAPGAPTPPAPPGTDEEDDDEEAAKARKLERKAAARTRQQVESAWMDGAAGAWELIAGAQLSRDVTDAIRILEENVDDEPAKAAVPPALRRLIRDLAKLFDTSERWRKAVDPLIAQHARQSVERISASLSIGFDELSPGIAAYAAKEGAELVTGIGATTLDALKAILIEALEAGDAVPAIAKSIREATAFSTSRATLIARTEVTRIANGAQRSSLSDFAARTSSRITKEWQNSGDDRVRDEHLDAPAGVGTEVREIDELFSNGLLEPSEPNCRCTLLYTVED